MQSLVQSCRIMLYMVGSFCDKQQVLTSVAMCSGAEAAFAFKYASTAGSESVLVMFISFSRFSNSCSSSAICTNIL